MVQTSTFIFPDAAVYPAVVNKVLGFLVQVKLLMLLVKYYSSKR